MRSPRLRPAPGPGPAYRLLWAGTLVNRLGGAVAPFLSLYLARDRGFSAAGVGAVLALLGVGGLLSQPLGGRLADRIGRRDTLVAGTVAAGVALALLGLARGGPAIGLAAVAVGATQDLYRPAAQALVADLVDPARRPRAFGLLAQAGNLGFAIAGLLGGALARAGYGWLFALDVATSLAFAVLVRLRLPADTRRPAHPAGSLRPAFADRPFLALAGLQLGYALLFFQLFSTVALATRAEQLTGTGYGLLLALNGLLVAAGQPLLAGRLGRLPRSVTLAAGQLTCGLGLGLLAVLSGWAGFAVAVAVFTAGEVALTGLVPAVIADLAPAPSRGAYFGLYGLTFGLAAAAGPALGSTLYATAGPRALWIGCAVLGLALAAGQLRLRPALEARRSAGAARPEHPALQPRPS